MLLRHTTGPTHAQQTIPAIPVAPQATPPSTTDRCKRCGLDFADAQPVATLRNAYKARHDKACFKNHKNVQLNEGNVTADAEMSKLSASDVTAEDAETATAVAATGK